MQKFKLLISFFLLLIFFSCESDESLDNSINLEKKIVFWSDFQGPPIDVFINNSFKGTITAINSTAPDCNSSGNVTVDVTNSSVIQLYAEEQQTGRIWEKKITILDFECYRFRLFE